MYFGYNKSNAINKKSILTYSLTITLDIVTVGWAFCLIDVWKNTNTCLIHAHQILSAWRAIMYQTVFSVVSCYSRPTGCPKSEMYTANQKTKSSTQFKRPSQHCMRDFIVVYFPQSDCAKKTTEHRPIHSPALIFDSFDWYDCFGIHYIDSIHLLRLPITVFTLQWTTFHIP